MIPPAAVFSRGSRRRRSGAASLQAPTTDRWLLSYSDFVTLLLAVFVVLFAFAWKQKQPIQTFSSAMHSGFDPHVEQSTLPVTAVQPGLSSVRARNHSDTDSTQAQSFKTRDYLFNQLESILRDPMERGEIAMQQTPEGIVISLHELSFFGSAQAGLLPGAGEKLTDAIDFLKQQPAEIRIEGHSDNQPIHSTLYHSNWELSVARAVSVMKLMVNQIGFPESRLSVAGYGPFRPVASNETTLGRQQNRRVDLVILPVPVPPMQRHDSSASGR